MPHTFHIPSRFHPGHSLLGRYLRRRTGDRWQAQGWLIVIVTLLGTSLLIGHIFLWTLWRPVGAAAWWTGGVEAALVVLGVAATLAGKEPAITVRCSAQTCHLRQGTRRLTVPYAAITAIETVGARRFHRHERRYAGTQVFVNRVPEEVLLLRTDESMVALGLMTPAERKAFCEAVESQNPSAYETA